MAAEHSPLDGICAAYTRHVVGTLAPLGFQPVCPENFDGDEPAASMHLGDNLWLDVTVTLRTGDDE
jgi:hypothetical protein